MFNKAALLSFATLAISAAAQQVGTLTAETHPQLTWQTCTALGSCTTQTSGVTLDANWRWVHSTSGSTNCYTGNTWNPTYCPANDGVTCAKNCALDGADYSGTYGITSSGNALTLKLVTGSNVGSRVYLLAPGSDTTYQLFKLKNQEFAFDVDVSKLPCGLNGALYLSEMDADGGMSKYANNKAGAKYGTGYCDSQCPHDIKFINGEANINNWTGASNNGNTGTGQYGTCCNEMDIWEANSISSAYTPHGCTVDGQYRCSGVDCGDGADRENGVCDKSGCDFNSYRNGVTNFYGPGETVDTTKKITVVTQYLTADGTATGALSEIRRFYVQNGVTIANTKVNYPGVAPYDSITAQYCADVKAAQGDPNDFAAKGGFTPMDKALTKGMVLVLSIWDDYAVNMLWLDSDYPTTADPSQLGVPRGTCPTTSGVPSQVESQSPNSQVIYSNIKIGPIGSTYAPPTGGSSSSSSSRSTSSSSRSTSTSSVRSSSTSSSRTTSTSTSSTRSSSANGAGQTKWGQCAGQGYTGPTNCIASTCTYSNPWYSQCL